MNSQPRSYLQSSKSSDVHFTTQGASTASTSELSNGDGKTRRNRIWESAATAHPPHQSRSADIPTTQLAMWSLLKVVCIHADFTTNRPIDWAITTLCKPFRSTELCPIRRRFTTSFRSHCCVYACMKSILSSWTNNTTVGTCPVSKLTPASQ